MAGTIRTRAIRMQMMDCIIESTVDSTNHVFSVIKREKKTVNSKVLGMCFS